MAAQWCGWRPEDLAEYKKFISVGRTRNMRLKNSFQLRTSEGHLGFLIQRKVPHSLFQPFVIVDNPNNDDDDV